MGWEAFSKNTQFELRVGNRVKFCPTLVVWDQSLQLTFLVLYEISINRESSVDFCLARRAGGEEFENVAN